jgi:hypothetical protein
MPVFRWAPRNEESQGAIQRCEVRSEVRHMRRPNHQRHVIPHEIVRKVLTMHTSWRLCRAAHFVDRTAQSEASCRQALTLSARIAI